MTTTASLLDQYEAVRSTPGPERAAVLAALRPALRAEGVTRHNGYLYWWDTHAESVYRRLANSDRRRRVIPADRFGGRIVYALHRGRKVPGVWV